MKKLTFAGGSAVLLAAIAAFVLLTTGASGATPPAPPTISSGTHVPWNSLGTSDQAMLARIGATGQITEVGSVGGTSFYAVDGSDGGHCYAFGRSGGGLSGGCMRPDANVPIVIDMSTVVMNPTDGSWKLDTLQGIAADGIVAVGFVDADGITHTTPVIGNVYRLPGQAFTGGASSQIVGLDASGQAISTAGLGTS